MDHLKQGADALFILLGAVMVLAMHAGFAFLELGTVRGKNQVNALVKILADFCVSTIVYFFVGYTVAYGVDFFVGAGTLAQNNGYALVKFFFLLTFAAAIPAIISGGIAERAKFGPQLIATGIIVGVFYPLCEGAVWHNKFGFEDWLQGLTGGQLHDFAGSVVVHAFGGWIALPAVLILGARRNRYRKDGAMSAHPPSSIPFLALGSWILAVGWFGFNVMSAQTIDKISGLVAVNSLMALVGGTLVAVLMGKNDPGFAYNGPLAGLVAVCAGSDVMHPAGALVVGGIAGAIFVFMFTLVQNKWKIDDVLGVWPLHGLCGTWWYRSRHLWADLIGWRGRCQPDDPSCGHTVCAGLGPFDRRAGLRCTEQGDGFAPVARRRIRRRGPVDPPHQSHARAGSVLVKRPLRRAWPFIAW